VVVMTSNLGGEAPRERMGFAGAGSTPSPTAAEAATEELRRFFRPELLNRIDEIVAFRALDPADVGRIVAGALEELVSALARRHGVALR